MRARPRTRCQDAAGGERTSELANSVVIGIVAFLLLLAMFWFVVEVGQPEPIEITHAQTAWGESSNGTPRLQLSLTFANPHAFPIQLNQVTYAMDVNDRRTAAGGAAPDIDVPATGNRTVPVDIPLPPDFAERWWVDHARNDEETSVSFAGEAVFQVNQETRSVSFGEDWSWNTEWMGDWNDEVANCPPVDADLCLAQSEHGWGAAGDVDSTLRFESHANGTLTIDEVRAGLRLQGNDVAARTQRPAADLEEGDTTDVSLTLAPDAAALRGWWPDHVAKCEFSDAAYLVDVTYTVTTTVTTGSGNNTTEHVETRQETVQWEFPLPAFHTQIACEP